jgi:hypothetical protein
VSRRPLDQDFEVAGHWCLPDEPQNVIAGQLRYNSRETRLLLNGTFRPLRSGVISAGDDPVSYPAIHGITQQGEAVTLLGAKRTSISLHFGSAALQQPEQIVATFMLIGAHAVPPVALSSVSFRVPGLQIWHSNHVIREDFNRDQADGSSRLTYEVVRPRAESLRVPAIAANIEFESRLTWKTDGFTEANARVTSWATIKPDSPQELTWYLDQWSKIFTMLTFIAGVPMAPDCIVAPTEDPMHVVDVLVALRDTGTCTHQNPHNFYLLRSDIGIPLESALADWFERYPKVHMPSRLAMSILGSEKLWLHVEFLSLMQALEGFHRSMHPGTYMDPASYEQVKARLEGAIPGEIGPDHKAALKSRLRYGNEISLRKRLDELTELIPKRLRQLVFGLAERVPREWVDTRHYYTHWDEALRGDALDGQGMYYANVRLRHFLRVIYLRLMGITEDALVKAISNPSDISQHLIQILAIERRAKDPHDRSGAIMRITEEKMTPTQATGASNSSDSDS